MRNNSAYFPFFFISSSWVPSSEIWPFSKNKMRSQKRVLDSLWEMKIEVRPSVKEAYFRYISFSAIGSNAAVGSSNTMMGPFL